ncbi:hypothetical protein TWF281_001764 [Arthrobotrys megalospora]
MTATVPKLILSVFYIFILLSPALKAAKTLSLDLIDESEKFYTRNLVRRQIGNGWRSTDIIYNATDFQFYVEVNVGDNNKNLRLGVIQNPYTWVASRWNRTSPCPPLTEKYACDRVLGSGFFNLYPPDSSTYQNLSDTFGITYVDNRYASGNWVRDKFRLGQLTVEDVNFGVARYYNASPVIGLERSDSGTEYPTFLEVMQTKDIINTPTYGIYAGDIRGRQDSGKSITFGGIDVAKFTWPLRTFSSRSNYALNLLSIQVVSSGNVVDTPLDQPGTSPVNANLNFGTASIHLPKAVYDAMNSDIGALPSNDYYINTPPPEGSGLNFTFTDGLSIFVPYSQMITPVGSVDGTTWYLVLAVQNDRQTVLGTPFFRSAYVFYDFENSEFSVAPALYNVTASNVTEVGVNNASVTALEWLQPIPVENNPPPPPPPTDTSTPPPPPQPTTSGTKTPVAAIAGGTVGGVVVLVAIIGICYYFFSYRPKHQNTTMPAPPMENAYSGGAMPPTSPNTNNGFANEQFSPAKPVYSSPVTSPITSPVSELSSGTPWGRPENAAMHGAHRNPNVHEMA